MKKILLALSAAFLPACSTDSVAPRAPAADTDASAFVLTAVSATGPYGVHGRSLGLLSRLPEHLKLTSEQHTRIRELLNAFETATRADREALLAIAREAHAAIEAGKSREEVRAILVKGAPVQERLLAAHRKLVSNIDAVLTAEQRAWLAANGPARCDPSKVPPLTEAQRAQIRELERAFHEANRADIEAIRSAMERARAAVLAGKSREEVAKILEEVRPILERLAGAQRALAEKIASVLTPEQKASGCFRLG